MLTPIIYFFNILFTETLRKHPPLPLIPRTCTKDYNIPGTDVVIESGTTVEIPTLSIQRDPEYYPDPDKFDPERFNVENKANRHPYAYIPFGEGHRICIGNCFLVYHLENILLFTKKLLLVLFCFFFQYFIHK